ncbi:hypothetical protein Ancab_036257 [Ancistrocladus abbreviatus]
MVLEDSKVCFVMKEPVDASSRLKGSNLALNIGIPIDTSMETLLHEAFLKWLRMRRDTLRATSDRELIISMTQYVLVIILTLYVSDVLLLIVDALEFLKFAYSLLSGFLAPHKRFEETTYENFRYRTDSRVNVYDRGCLNNFFEVFCTAIKPSRNNFRAFVQEEVRRLPPRPPPQETGMDDLGDQRMKVEDDMDIGGDLLKISQRRNIEDIHEDIRSRGSNAPHHSSEVDSALGSEYHSPAHGNSSWGRRSGSWEIAPDVPESRV